MSVCLSIIVCFVAFFAIFMVAELIYILWWMKSHETEYQKFRRECESGKREDEHV